MSDTRAKVVAALRELKADEKISGASYQNLAILAAYAMNPDVVRHSTIYLVQREGIFGRGFVGIFTTEALAEKAARSAAAEEFDDHHAFVCYQVQTDLRLTLAFEFPRSPESEDYVFILKLIYQHADPTKKTIADAIANGRIPENKDKPLRIVVKRPTRSGEESPAEASTDS